MSLRIVHQSINRQNIAGEDILRAASIRRVRQPAASIENSMHRRQQVGYSAHATRFYIKCFVVLISKFLNGNFFQKIIPYSFQFNVIFLLQQTTQM